MLLERGKKLSNKDRWFLIDDSYEVEIINPKIEFNTNTMTFSLKNYCEWLAKRCCSTVKFDILVPDRKLTIYGCLCSAYSNTTIELTFDYWEGYVIN